MELFEFIEHKRAQFAVSELTCPACGSDALPEPHYTVPTRESYDNKHRITEHVTCGACQFEMDLVYELKGFARYNEPVASLTDAGLDFWADSCGLVFEWAPDWEVDHRKEYGYEKEPETCEQVRLYDPDTGETLAYLGCIDDASEDYRSSIERDLCQEAYQARVRRFRGK